MARDLKTKDDLIIMFKVQIPRLIFSYSLNIIEIRLCVLLSSIKTLSVNNLTYNEKLYIVGGKHSEIKNIPIYASNLIKIGLLEKNGTGLNLKNNNIPSFNISPIDFYNAKSMREIFALCCKVWKGKNTNFAQITDEEVCILFDKKYLKRYLNRLNKSLQRFNFKLEYELTRNGYHQFNVILDDDNRLMDNTCDNIDLSGIGSVKNKIPNNYNF